MSAVKSDPLLSINSPSFRPAKALSRSGALKGAAITAEGQTFAQFSLYCPVDDDDEEEDDEDEAAGRVLRRCWLYGMPRCTDR